MSEPTDTGTVRAPTVVSARPPRISQNTATFTNSEKIIIGGGTSTSSFAPAQIERDENAILAGLSPKRRWSLIARKHPAEFWGSVASIVIAVYVLVRASWGVLGFVGSVLIQTARAEGSEKLISVGSWSVSLLTFVSILLAIVLLWLFGMISIATASDKITFARDTVKTLIGFFTGLVTGAVAK